MTELEHFAKYKDTLIILFHVYYLGTAFFSGQSTLPQKSKFTTKEGLIKRHCTGILLWAITSDGKPFIQHFDYFLIVFCQRIMVKITKV